MASISSCDIPASDNYFCFNNLATFTFKSTTILVLLWFAFALFCFNLSVLASQSSAFRPICYFPWSSLVVAFPFPSVITPFSMLVVPV